MRTSGSFLFAAALTLAAAVTAPQALAQADTNGNYVAVGTDQNVFFSPSGQPFRSAVGQPYPLAAWLAQADKDHDGKISHDEFVADAMAFFTVLDVNHDGYISSLENTRYEMKVAPEITVVDPRIQQPKIHVADYDPEMDTTKDDMPNGGKYIKQILGASQYGLIDEPQPVRAADANFDFRISTDEWLNATNQRFAILDRNGDGYITVDELPRTPAQQAEDLAKGKKEEKKKRFGMW